MEVDSDYEFNAPKYIDFLSNEPENEHIDTWFDENPDGHEGGIRISQVPFISQHSDFQAATRAISAALNGSSSFEEGLAENEPMQEEKPKECKALSGNHDSLPEINMDRKDNHHRSASSDQTQIGSGTKQGSVAEAMNENEETANIAPHTSQGDKTIMKETAKNDQENGKKKNMKRATRSYTPDQKKKTPPSALRKRKHSWNLNNVANDKSGKMIGEGFATKKPKVEMKKPLITMPNTPSFLRRLRGKSGNGKNNGKKTSETLEIEKIKALQEETKKQLKNNETFLHKALAPQAVLQTKRATDVTKTIEFHFATDARIKQHPMKTRGDGSDKEKFVEQLRKHPPSPTFKNRKPTKPRPFKFSAEIKGNKAEGGQWKSVASAVNDFQNKTPDRWRSRPASQQNVGPQESDKNKTRMELTHPKTPQLMTKGRSRPASVPSQAELENKLAEEVASYKFKAREFNPKLVEMSGMYGVEPMKRLPITEAKPFNFNSDVRLEQRKKHDDEKKNEEHLQKPQEQEDAVEKRNLSLDLNPGRKRPRVTEPKPFSFERRDKQMMQKKQAKIQKVYEEEEKAREFHAQPLPSLSPDLIPVKSGKHTEIAPFNLATDERGAVKMEKWTAQVTNELEAEKEKVAFKARPCKVIHKEGFRPKPAEKPLVEISEFKLNTEERSKKRESYEIMKKEQQRIKEDEMQQSLKEKKADEERRVALLRKQTIHKANPIRNFGDFELKRSDRPLTLPATPNFETNKRLGKLSRA